MKNFKKTIIIQTLLFALTTICFGQNRAENKNISICNLQSDTLTYKQLKNCKTISVKGKKAIDIKSFSYAYLREDNKTYEDVAGTNNSITQTMIDNTIKYKIKKALIDNVMVNDGQKIINYGCRVIYLK